MKIRKSFLLLFQVLIVSTAFVNCRTQTSPSTDIAEVPPMPGATDDSPEIIDGAGLANELSVNEDVRRSATFKLNTLVYELPGMEDVEVLNITYSTHEERPLTMDVYYPPRAPQDARLPVVIFGLGYRRSMMGLRDAHFYTSWGRLVAAAGMVGVSYDTEQPDRDLEMLVAFIREHDAALRIDPARIGFLSSSANVATVMSYLMQEGREGVRFSVYYYGNSLTPDRKYAEPFGDNCARRGCLFNELADVTFVDPDLPLFIVKAGRDFVPTANEAWDHFVAYARDEGAPVTVVEYEDGEHGFDTGQKTEESTQIIADTVAFMKEQFGMEE